MKLQGMNYKRKTQKIDWIKDFEENKDESDEIKDEIISWWITKMKSTESRLNKSCSHCEQAPKIDVCNTSLCSYSKTRGESDLFE